MFEPQTKAPHDSNRSQGALSFDQPSPEAARRYRMLQALTAEMAPTGQDRH